MNDNNSPKSPNVRSGEQCELSQAEHYKFIMFMVSNILDSIYDVAGRAGQTLSETCVMGAIANGTFQEDYQFVTQLSNKYGLPKSTVSDYVARYLASGLVKETFNADDRRHRYLSLTPLGIIASGKICDRLNGVRKAAHEAGMPLTKIYTVK